VSAICYAVRMAKKLTGFALFSALMALIAACGGSALTEGVPSNAGAGGDASSGAGSGSSGASSFGGSSAAGGSSAGMTSAAGAPAAGASGDPCSAPMAQGNCDAYQPSFWHNPKSGLCEQFIYGGCGGNRNRYPNRLACLQTCGGGGSDWGACEADSDCTLTGTGCCGDCDPIVDTDLLALNASHLPEHLLTRPCANTGVCLPCPVPSVLTATRKYFRPVCVAGQCSALDVRQSAYTQCSDSGDCSLRDGVNCCLGCDGSRFVAVNANANFCPNGPEPCGKCASTPPPNGLGVTCRERHCALEELPK
jgi:hypothetical protein